MKQADWLELRRLEREARALVAAGQPIPAHVEARIAELAHEEEHTERLAEDAAESRGW